MANTDLSYVSPTGIRMSRLKKLNIVAGLAHLTQMVLILYLANDFTLPVTAAYPQGPPGTPLAEPVTLFDSRIAWGVALFFFLSAFFQLMVVMPGIYPKYVRGLLEGHDYFRWAEYSISSSVMIVLIAQIVGITDVAALIAIFGVNASMILFGWLQEKFETPGSGGMLPFAFGCFAGIIPWLIVVLFVVAPGSASPVETPGFVYGIIISLFVFFNSFALVQYLQYKPVGKWADYLRGERAYIWLSLIAKSALAWQIFSGTLVPPA